MFEKKCDWNKAILLTVEKSLKEAEFWLNLYRLLQIQMHLEFVNDFVWLNHEQIF